MSFCGCSDDSVFRLAKLAPFERAAGTNNLGMKSIVTCTTRKVAELDVHGKALIQQCTDFLVFMKLYTLLDQEGISESLQDDSNHSDCVPNRSVADITKIRAINELQNGKYITIWSFIYDFLKIPRNSGYDYWLMNFLCWNHIMDHGSGIRCGWLDNYYSRDLLIIDEHIESKIVSWIKSSPIIR